MTAKVLKRKIKKPQKHMDVDHVYAAARNKHIPEAVKFANEGAGEIPVSAEMRMDWGGDWNKLFHTKMNELWKGEVMSDDIASR